MQDFFKKTPLKERRRRERIPSVLLFFALVILMMPFTNYIGLAYKYQQPPIYVHEIFSRMNISEYVFLFSAFFSGLGLLLIKRWGWWLFVSASGVFLARNLFTFIAHPEYFDRGIHAVGGPVVHTLFVFFALVYFLRRDIFMPYLSVHRSGWRFYKRYGIQVPVQIDENRYETENISQGGVFVLCNDCHQPLSSGVRVRFEIAGEDFEFDGGVASRLPEHGIGIAFRNADKRDASRLKRALAQQNKKS